MNIPDELHIREPYGHLGEAGKIVITTTGDKIVHGPETTDFLWDHQVLESVNSAAAQVHFLGLYNEQQVFALELDSQQCATLSLQTSDLRTLLGKVPDGLFRLLGRALQINGWYSGHRYCGRCGGVTEVVANERAMGCTQCKSIFYPRLSPCVMALVTRGEHCLLARNSQWPAQRFSALAGFIEPGESVEDALRREVMEEVGVRVGKLEYFNSQPWPFPSQLMMGFFAEYDSGDIQVDGVEIAEAHWYHYTALPTIPGEYSLSGQLIRTFITRCQQG